jgi:uncharacterized SAM-binding protein YcdF (DUF218 family)
VNPLPGTGTRSRTRSARVKPHNKAPHFARSSSRRRRRSSLRTRLILLACLIVAGLLSWAAIARYRAPTSNTSLTRFDAIIVLGSPADRDGNPTPLQLSRVNEAVQEYERGVAPRLIFTGGPTRKRFVEAEVMARTARAEGIPDSAIVVEGQALDTIHNACYSVRIMRNRGWHSAEVVSAPSHLPRTGLIFSRMPIEWRTHAAPRFEGGSGWPTGILSSTLETIKTVRYLLWTRQTEQCEP